MTAIDHKNWLQAFDHFYEFYCQDGEGWSQECEAWDSYCGQYVTTSPEPEFWKPLGELPSPIKQSGEGHE